MTTGVNCTVLLDGVRVADGSPGDNLSAPVVLSALTVTWGRSDTMQQPEADSCSFDVMDASGEGFPSFRTGSRVDVVARGLIPGTEALPTFTNPGFESAAVSWTGTNGSPERSSQRVQNGSNALKFAPSTKSAPGSVVLAPRPFSPAGTLPDAWDDTPTTELGQVWPISLAVWIPTGATVEIRPALFTGPYADAWTPADVAPVTVVGNNTWQSVAFEYAVQHQKAYWLGIELRLFPSGPAWNDVPDYITWDLVDSSLTWDDFGTLYIDDAQVTAPSASSGSSVLVFSGRVTDLASQWDDSANAPLLSVTAGGFTADLENRRVGDEPWPVEDVDARTHRILDLAGLPISIDIDTSLDAILLSYADVDSQGALGLLQTVSTSVDGVLWPAVHQAIGAYLRLEDPAMRTSLLTFEEVITPAVVQRRNLAIDPRATSTNVPINQVGWRTTRWFGGGGGAGTHTLITGAGDGPEPGVTTYLRKTWTTPPSTMGNSGDTGFFNNHEGVNGYAVVPGQTYTFSAWVRTSVKRCMNMGMYFHNAAGTFLSRIVGPEIVTIPGVWARLQATVTIPANVAFVTFVTDSNAKTTSGAVNWAAGSTLDGTALLIEQVSGAAGTYFDGSTADTPTADYAWTGAANASQSTQSAPATREIIIVKTDPDIGVNISACDILRDPVTWQQSVSDIATRASVTWKLQGVDEAGLPTTEDVTETLVDEPLEQQHGTRSVSASTELQSQADARSVASKILARTSSDAWRANGITLDDEDLSAGEANVRLLLTLLNGTSRIGLPIVLDDLPQWAPAGETTGVYLEGGSYAFSDGRWVLALTVSSSEAGLGASAAWDEMNPAWAWNEFDPAITWDDLRGVSA